MGEGRGLQTRAAQACFVGLHERGAGPGDRGPLPYFAVDELPRTLEGEGLIEIAMVEADLRRRAVWLTEAGARRLEAAIPVWRRAHAKLAKLLSPDLARRLADEAEALIRDPT